MKLGLYVFMVIIFVSFVFAFDLDDLPLGDLPTPSTGADSDLDDAYDSASADERGDNLHSSTTFYDDPPENYSPPAPTNPVVLTQPNTIKNASELVADLRAELNSKFLTESEIQSLISQYSLSESEILVLIEEYVNEKRSPSHYLTYILSGGVIFLVVLILIILFVTKKNLKGKGVKVESNVNELVEYIKKNSSFSSVQLRLTLAQGGWSDKDIAQAFKIVGRS